MLASICLPGLIKDKGRKSSALRTEGILDSTGSPRTSAGWEVSRTAIIDTRSSRFVVDRMQRPFQPRSSRLRLQMSCSNKNSRSFVIVPSWKGHQREFQAEHATNPMILWSDLFWSLIPLGRVISGNPIRKEQYQEYHDYQFLTAVPRNVLEPAYCQCRSRGSCSPFIQMIRIRKSTRAIYKTIFLAGTEVKNSREVSLILLSIRVKSHHTSTWPVALITSERGRSSR
jgi:hypothetical protein